MFEFTTRTAWRARKECSIHARNNPAVIVATPPEFDGPQDTWSPEELFVASVGSCLMSTFLYFAETGGVEFQLYQSTSRGLMEKTPEGLRFTKIEVDIEIDVDDPQEARKVMKLEK